MEGEEVKKERPQNKNLKPLGSGMLTPEEERAIRQKGAIAAQKARHENAELRWRVRKLLTMGSKKGKIADIESINNLEDALKKNIPLIDKIILTEVQRYFQTGDKESRNWLVDRYGDVVNALDNAGLTITTEEQGGDSAAPGVRIQLIRGMKPPPPAPASDAQVDRSGEAATQDTDVAGDAALSSAQGVSADG